MRKMKKTIAVKDGTGSKFEEVDIPDVSALEKRIAELERKLNESAVRDEEDKPKKKVGKQEFTARIKSK